MRGVASCWPVAEGVEEDSLIAHVLKEGAGSLVGMGLYLEPPTDDMPFFFQNVRPFSAYDRELLERFSVNERAAVLPRILVLSLGGLTLLLFFAPFLAVRRVGRGPFFWRGSVYFVAIGLGFMLVEIPLIQKFILYLGHPSYATTVVLSVILLGAGVGSFLAGRYGPSRIGRLRFLAAVAALVVSFLLPSVFSLTLGWGFAARVAVSVLLVGPLGVVLGFAFPWGLMFFGDETKAWFWALNGAASVLASVAVLALAAYVGLTQVIWIGAVCYVVAALCLSPKSASMS